MGLKKSLFLNLSMPRKEKIARAKLAALIDEQAKDAESGFILPEKITPRKTVHNHGLPPGISEIELMHLALEIVPLNRKKIAKEMKVTLACVRQHRWNLHRKLGPEFNEQWQKILPVLREWLFSLLNSSSEKSSSSSVCEGDGKDDLLSELLSESL